MATDSNDTAIHIRDRVLIRAVVVEILERADGPDLITVHAETPDDPDDATFAPFRMQVGSQQLRVVGKGKLKSAAKSVPEPAETAAKSTVRRKRRRS
jgi:hypothetical protein